MVALGVTDKQIGLIASISMALQMFSSLLGGYVTDKLGRKRTSLIFDTLSWSIPTLIWAVAQNFYYFLVAAIINSLVRVVHTSWTCLLVEDTAPEDRVHAYTLLQVAGILAGFVAPLGGLLVKRFELVPALEDVFLRFYFYDYYVFLKIIWFRDETGSYKNEESKRNFLAV